MKVLLPQVNRDSSSVSWKSTDVSLKVWVNGIIEKYDY